MNHATVDGIKLFYKTVRNGIETASVKKDCTTMLVLHGGPGIVDHQIEFDAWKAFSNKLQVIFIDQRGCGRSDDGNPSDWTLKRCGQDIKEFCDVLDISNPVVAGVSWGGYVAMSYATQFPSHPSGLILTNTEGKVELTEKIAAYKLAINRLEISSNTEPFAELGTNLNAIAERVGEIACEYDKNPSDSNFSLFVKYCVPLFSRKSFELKPPYRVNMAMRKTFIKNESLSMDFNDQLHKVTCPVLQLAGEYDPTHPPACARRTAACFPNAKYICIPDAGAPVYQDQAEHFNEAINQFIASTFPSLDTEHHQTEAKI